MYLIDTPTEFATLEVWRAYLADLEEGLAEDPGASELIEAIREARKHIAEAEGNRP